LIAWLTRPSLLILSSEFVKAEEEMVEEVVVALRALPAAPKKEVVSNIKGTHS